METPEKPNPLFGPIKSKRLDDPDPAVALAKEITAEAAKAEEEAAFAEWQAHKEALNIQDAFKNYQTSLFKAAAPAPPPAPPAPTPTLTNLQKFQKKRTEFRRLARSRKFTSIMIGLLSVNIMVLASQAFPLTSTPYSALLIVSGCAYLFLIMVPFIDAMADFRPMHPKLRNIAIGFGLITGLVWLFIGLIPEVSARNQLADKTVATEQRQAQVEFDTGYAKAQGISKANAKAILGACGATQQSAYQTQAETFFSYADHDGIQTTLEKLNQAYAMQIAAC